MNHSNANQDAVTNRGEAGAHDSGADMTGNRRDSEKDVQTPQPGEGSKPASGAGEADPKAELGHS